MAALQVIRDTISRSQSNRIFLSWQDNFTKVKDKTYELLSASPGANSKEVLKSEVLHALSPSSKSSRKKLEKAWKKVEAEVGGDGRVECIAGDGVERWTWTSPRRYTRAGEEGVEDGKAGEEQNGGSRKSGRKLTRVRVA